MREEVTPTAGLAVCFSALLVANGLALTLGLIIPPAIIGLCLLLGAMLISARLLAACRSGCQLLLEHLGLMILPAAVGAIWLAPRWLEHWLALVLVIVVATLIALVAIAWSLNRILNRSPS